MKKCYKKRVLLCIAAMFSAFAVLFSGCGEKNEYILDESTFFFVMNNLQYYPEQYQGKNIEFACFTYDLTDVDGAVYRCGVRKCSSGYGCTCGNDTIIGFILDYGGKIPEPKNQSENTNEKTWINLKGTLASSNKTKISIYAYNADGSVDETRIETIEFLTFSVEKLSIITDYSGLNYYVVK